MELEDRLIIFVCNDNFFGRFPMLSGNVRCKRIPLCDNQKAGIYYRTHNGGRLASDVRDRILECVQAAKASRTTVDWRAAKTDITKLLRLCLCKQDHKQRAAQAEMATLQYLQEACGNRVPATGYNTSSTNTVATPALSPPTPPPPPPPPPPTPPPPAANHTYAINTPPVTPQPASYHGYQPINGPDPNVQRRVVNHAYQHVNGTYSSPLLSTLNHTYQHIAATDPRLLRPVFNQTYQHFNGAHVTFPGPVFTQTNQSIDGTGPSFLPPVPNNAFPYVDGANPSPLHPSTKYHAPLRPANGNPLGRPPHNSQSGSASDSPSHHPSAKAAQNPMRHGNEHGEPTLPSVNKIPASPVNSDQSDCASDHSSTYHTAPSSQVPVTSASPVVCQRSIPPTCKLIHQFRLCATDDTRKKILDEYIDWAEEKAHLVDKLEEENAELVEENTELTEPEAALLAQNASLEEEVARLTEQSSATGLQSSTHAPARQPKKTPRGFGVRTRSATKAAQNAQQTQGKASWKKVASYGSDCRKPRASKRTPRPPIEELSDEQESSYIYSDSESEDKEL